MPCEQNNLVSKWKAANQHTRDVPCVRLFRSALQRSTGTRLSSVITHQHLLTITTVSTCFVSLSRSKVKLRLHATTKSWERTNQCAQQEEGGTAVFHPRNAAKPKTQPRETRATPGTNKSKTISPSLQKPCRPPHLGLSVLGGGRSLLEAVLEAAGEGLHVPVDVVHTVQPRKRKHRTSDSVGKKREKVSAPASINL